MHRLLHILFLMLIALSIHAQQAFHARVVDAETGEAMPFVNVYQTSGRGCVSNAQGDFTIVADAKDSLRFSFVGYQTCKWRAGEMPQVVKMQPSALSVAGVTVLSDEAILTRTYKILKNDFKSHAKERRTYLNRITIRSGGCEEMVEDFLTARSAVNVRNMSVLSGQYWTRIITGEQVMSQMQYTNLHNLMEGGPMMRKVPLEEFIIQPFPETFSSSFMKYYFATSCQTLQADGGSLMYVVSMMPKVDTWKNVLYGNLYIDAKTFRLLRFDGALRGMRVLVSRHGGIEDQVQDATIRLQVHYTHQRGFTEVDKASAQIQARGLVASMVLAGAEDVAAPSEKGVLVKENLLKAILAAGTNPDLQQNAQFLQRTEEERQIAENAATNDPIPTLKNQPKSPILSYIQKAMNFNKVVPQEKVYLHFDNMGYFENETLWFKAYVTRTDNGHLSDLSKVLYVELLNPTGDVLQTLKYPIDSLGQSHGEMKLDTILGSGLYEVRAYTRYMTNWGTNAVFSRVIPIFKKPAKEGDYSDLTIATIPYHERIPNRRDPLDTLYARAVAEEIYTDRLAKTISVQFYPEGGDLVVGKKCRVAMLAVDDNGYPHESEGFVMNEAGDVLASVKTDTLGRGIFEVVPDTGKLTFQMRNLYKKENHQVQFFSLPKAKEEGCALHVDAVSERMLATLQCTDKMCGRQLGYVLMHNGNIFRCDTLTAAPLIEIELDRQAMPEGVNQMTFFDSWGRIVAERLFFLCPKPDKEDSIRIVAKTNKLQPCGKVELELRTKPNANLSFSAIDAQTMTNGKQGNMKTWMLLSSEVKGYIHNVDYYFEKDDKEHRLNADLLMLTQGWRRYDWRLMSERYTFRKAQPIEDQFYLNGQLKVYRKHNPVSNVRMYVSLYNQKGQSLIGNARTDSLGNYAFKMPFMDGEWKMCIYTTRDIKKKDKKKEKRKTYYVGIDRQFSPNPRYLTPLETTILHPLAPNAFVKKPFEELEEEDEFIPITEKDHILQNVTVKAKRRYFTNDDWRWKNEAYGKQYATIYYDADRELDNILDRGEPVPRTIDFIRSKLKAELDKYGQREYVIDGRNIAFVVDNNEGGGYSEYLNYVKSIYIVFQEMMSPTLGMWNIIDSPEHNIIVYLYTHRLFSSESQKGLRRTYFQGFNQASTFKTEDYSIIPPMADFRRTIWWQPDIKTDEQGKAHVEFFNNSTCEEMYISVEGMTEDGKVLVNE